MLHTLVNSQSYITRSRVYTKNKKSLWTQISVEWVQRCHPKKLEGETSWEREVIFLRIAETTEGFKVFFITGHDLYSFSFFFCQSREIHSLVGWRLNEAAFLSLR